MRVAKAEHALVRVNYAEYLPADDPIPTVRLLLRGVLPTSDAKPLRGTRVKERSTLTMRQRTNCARHAVAISLPLRPGRHEIASRPTIQTGRTISHYRILGRLANGGMGVVYKAKDMRLRRHVALKFASDDLMPERGVHLYMHREAFAASASNHPNVCTVYDAGEYGGRPFIVMELLEGETLKERIHEPLPLEQFLHLAIQISDGLHAVHERGIVHRDIKPSNIFITPNDHVKIFDFGLAIVVERAGMTSRGRPTRKMMDLRASADEVLGTPMYMSPENVRGERLDARADLFSLGIVFYEMLTGEHPFRGSTQSAIVEAVLWKSFVSVSKLRPDLPHSLVQLVETTLEKNREFRCQAASEIRADLKRIQRDLRLGGSP